MHQIYRAACHYCGEMVGGKCLTVDHVHPKVKGGKNTRDNCVQCCNVCNSIKGARTFEQSRPRLVQKMLNWPKFTVEQIDWLRARGFDTSEYDNAQLYCERPSGTLS